MTEEDKQLLLKDLCARLPYNVRCLHKEDDGEDYVDTIVGFDGCRFEIEEQFYDIEDFKPYLRPMSSMTDKELDKLWNIWENDAASEAASKVTDFLNKKYLDHHHLIEKGLALEAPEGMYK